MGVALRYLNDEGRLIEVAPDVALVESHSHSAKATDFPVESGASISDHVVQQPDVVKLEGVISDSPLPSAVGMDTETFLAAARSGEFESRGADAYWQLLEIKEAGTPVLISTTLRNHLDMVIESIEVSEEDGGLTFSITAKHIEMATVSVVPVPAVESATAKVSKGAQATKSADSSTADKASTMARSLKGAVLGE